MNPAFGFLFLLLGSIICEEHIPRVPDPGSENIHKNILNEVASPPTQKDINEEIPLNNLPVNEPAKIQSAIREKEIPSLVYDSPESVSGGISDLHSSSYVTLTMMVKSGNVDCYYFKAINSFEVDYQVLMGGNFDIALSIYDHNIKRVGFHKSSNYGNIKIVVPPEMIDKDYSICFDNHDSSRHTKKVFMMIDVANSNHNKPDQLNKLDLMHTALSNIYTSLIQMEHLQERQRAIESIDRSIMERNYEYVTMWCIIQISVMLVVSAIQLILIRSLFDSKGGIGAKIWKKLHNLTGGRF